ncbi:MAG TPA: DegT/DnrJ/EryC1/StrS family aminotransferase [Terriglobales bacterium]|nr:DegT/DnrJ/EryC1/StrS family aminotransferase [Terriglobales bacterium]
MKIQVNSASIPFHRASVGEEEAQAVAEVVRSGWLTMGPKTIAFEQHFAEYIGVKHCIAVNSCTAALHLALEAVRIQAGDEVLVPTNTFTATGETVAYMNAQPVLVDIDPVSMNMDVNDAERKITSKTKAIVPVHIAGQPCDMQEIAELAQRRGLRVIEDAAHALPATYLGKKVGAISELTAFSFYATKTLTTGEGGMISTDNDALAQRMRIMRLHGIGRDAWKRYSAEGSWYYEVLDAGFKYNLTDLAAALGLVQLRRCDDMYQKRMRIANRYSEAFSADEALESPAVLPGRETAWHLYVLRLNLDRLSVTRNGFVEKLRKAGIGISVHFIPLHLHPYYSKTYGYKPGDLPNAEREYERYFSLPIFPDMKDEEVDYVIDTVLATVKEYRR